MAYELRHADAVSGRVRESEYEHISEHILNDQATGDLVYASSATQLSGLPIGTDNYILSVATNKPAWISPAALLADISPLTTRGDIMYRNATISTRLAKGADNTILAMGADDPEWKTPAVILGDLTGANFDVGAFDVRGQTVTADALTSGRVVFAGASGVLSDDSDFTFATDTLTVTKIAAFQGTGKISLGTSASKITVTTTDYPFQVYSILTSGQSEGLTGYHEGHIAGTTAGHTYGLGSWINVDTSAVLSAGHIITPIEGGVYTSEAQAAARVVFAGQHQAILNGAPASLHAWRLNTTQTVTALIAAANTGSVGYVAAVTEADAPVGYIPIADIVGIGVVYVRVYADTD